MGSICALFISYILNISNYYIKYFMYNNFIDLHFFTRIQIYPSYPDKRLSSHPSTVNTLADYRNLFHQAQQLNYGSLGTLCNCQCATRCCQLSQHFPRHFPAQKFSCLVSSFV